MVFFNKNKGKRLAFTIAMIGCGFFVNGESFSQLPTTEILGKQYYKYEVKKGESIYGIAKKNGWDIEELMRLNPEATSSVSKGDVLYYPTGVELEEPEEPKAVELDFASLPPVSHKVKKGETIYSISRQYGVPLEIIYRFNPASKKGVKAGDELEIPQNGTNGFYYYKVKKGDTLSSLAQQYNTSVEDILKANAGLTINNFKPDETIRISLNSNSEKSKVNLVSVNNSAKEKNNKTKKQEEGGIASVTKKDENEVTQKAQNESPEPLNRSDFNISEVDIDEPYGQITENPQPDFPENEINESTDSISEGVTSYNEFTGVRVALLLDEPTSKKDIDFTRGMLVALQGMEKSPYKIDLKVFDGRVSSGDITNELDSYEPNLIISTADKAFPLFLADYGNTTNVQIVNVFDLKNDLFEDNGSMIQLLPPSGIFNEKITSKFYKDFNKRRLIAVGEEDENDGLAADLFNLFDGAAENVSLEEFGSYEPDIMESYVIYSHAHKKEEIWDFFTNVDHLAENNPGIDFKIIGRGNWLTMLDEFNDKFSEYSVSIPTRVWLDETTPEWRSFTEGYEGMFGGSPVRSIPNYAASGYDVAEYFIPLVASTRGDFNNTLTEAENKVLQNAVKLERVNNWGGFINNIGYIVRFNPGGKIEKIMVK